MKKYNYYLSDNGNILVVTNDGSPSFFMSPAFKFDRCVSESQVKYFTSLGKKMPKFDFNGETLALPAIFEWQYLFSQHHAICEMDQNTNFSIQYFGRQQSFSKGQITTDICILNSYTDTNTKAIQLIGASDMPANVFPRGISKYKLPLEDNARVTLEELSNCVIKHVSWADDPLKLINIPHDVFIHVECADNNRVTHANAAQKTERDKILRKVFPISFAGIRDNYWM